MTSRARVRVHDSWRHLVEREVAKPYFADLKRFLLTEEKNGAKEIFPPRSRVFGALDACPLADVRVVILGQDPYHGRGQADGLAFSVPRDVAPPPSLRNIVKEASRGSASVPGAASAPPPPLAGPLTPHMSRLAPWAAQGVLLLNTVLTVREGEPRSHRGKGWEIFTDAVLREVYEQPPTGKVFLLWGRDAHAKLELLGNGDGGSGHHVLRASHPSPLAAARPSGNAPAFTGCGHFSLANELLVEAGHQAVDWSVH